MNVISCGPRTDDIWRTVSDEVLERLGRDTAEARGLPNAAFTDADFLELEKKRLFARSWVFAAPASLIPGRGDVLPLRIAGRPVILVRDGDGTVRAFHNVCPHRGTRLVTEGKRGKAVLTCPYHAWSFGLDGTLKGRPHYHGPNQHETGPANEAGQPCLFEIRSATWHDWVFVNLDGEAEPFESFIAPVEQQFEGYDLSTFRREEREMRFEFASNWKLVAENYCDFYHVFSVHPALDAAMSPQMRRAMWPGGCHMFNGYSFEGSGITIEDEALNLPKQPGLPPDRTSSMVFGLVFPNVAINVYPESLQFSLFEPAGVDRTIMRMWFYYVADAAEHPDFAAARDRVYNEWAALNAEDEGICRQLQEGRACEAYDGGRMAPYWDSGTIHFHKQIALAIRHEGAFSAATSTGDR